MRELKLHKGNIVSFYSWGRKIVRHVSRADWEEAKELIEQDDEIAIDYFCSRIM